MTQSIMVTSAFTGITSVKLAYSVNADMTSHSLTGALTVTANQLTIHTITGLADGTRYYYQPAQADGTLFGDVGTFKTNPATAALDMSIILNSCMSNAGSAGAFDPSEPTWHKIQDLGPHDLHIFEGDFHYQGALLAGAVTTRSHILKYGHQLENFDRMRDVFLKIPSIVMRSDHEYSGDDGDSNAAGTYGPVVRLMIDAALEMMPVPSGDWADTRTPKLGLWRSWKPGPDSNVLFIVTDFRNLERTLQATDDGPDKTALGATQLAWLQGELQRSDAVLKVVLSDLAWGPANEWSTLTSHAKYDDKWWSYQYEQAVIANMVQNLSTTDGKPIHVDYWGGDRHVLGWLAAANNVLGDGTPCDFDVLTASGADKNSLQAAPGEKYDEAFGFKPTALQNWEVRGFGHIRLQDNGTGTITRTFDGWNCATDITNLYTPQTYAPVKVIDGKVKTWSYDLGGYTPPSGSLLPDTDDGEALRQSSGVNMHANFTSYES